MGNRLYNHISAWGGIAAFAGAMLLAFTLINKKHNNNINNKNNENL